MLDQETYNQLSSVFDEWENECLKQPNSGTQLTLDYDEVLSDFEKLLPDEENSSDVKQSNNPLGANLSNWNINFGGVKVIQAEKICLKTMQESSSMVPNQDIVRAEGSEECYSTNRSVSRVQKQSNKKSSNVVSQSMGSQGGNLYFFDLKSTNKVRVASARALYPKIRQFIKKSEWLESEPIPANSTSQMTAETALDSEQNKKSTVTRSSSRLFDQKPTRTHVGDNQNVKESDSDFSPSM